MSELKPVTNSVHAVIILVCQDCIDLKGEECHEPECVFFLRGMNEVKKILNVTLICPIVDGNRIILWGNNVEGRH